MGIYLYQSPSHSSDVPLILNTNTANVSPQFHCIYDDEFATCKRDAKFKSLWQTKARLRFNSTSISNTPSPSTHFDLMPINNESEIPNQFVTNWETPTVAAPTTEHQPPLSERTVGTPIEPKEPQSSQGGNVTRYGRVIKPPERYSPTTIAMAFNNVFTPSDNLQTHLLQPSYQHFSKPNPLALAAKHMFSFLSADPDTMTLQDAMQQTDREQFLNAMSKELQ